MKRLNKYQGFVKRTFPKLRRKFPNSKPKTIMKKVAIQWRKMRITQREPQLIGKGASGCAYKPAVKCNGEEDPTVVAKLIGVDSYYEEVDGAIHMKRIDPRGNFSMVLLEQCDTGDIDKSLIDSCPILNGIDTKKLIYSDEGNSIRTMVCMDKDPGRAFRALLNTLFHIIQGLDIMVKKQTVHADIKADNISLKDGAKHAKLIDFGLVSTKFTFFNNPVFLNPYKYWPPEWITLMWLCYQKKIVSGYPIKLSQNYIVKLNNNPTVINLLGRKDELFQLMKQISVEEYITAMNTILSYGKMNQAGLFVSLVGLHPGVLITNQEAESSINFIHQANTIDDVYDRIFQSWDVYGLGMTIYMLYRGSCRSLFTKDDGSDLPNIFTMMVDGMLTYDFSSRMTPAEVVDMARKIIKKEIS